MRAYRTLAAVSLFSLMTPLAWAQQTVSSPQATTLQQAVRAALVTNPEVQARWHAFRSAEEEQDVARGGYYPRIDISGNVGHENITAPNSDDLNFNRHGGSLTLNQMIYDGFSTRDEVARLSYNKLAAYYELMDTSQTVALDATSAYLDLLRYRKLVEYAKDNYEQHKKLYDQVAKRAKAGVSNRSDLEQATGRLALAQSNLLTELSNLHDVSTRYLRIVGQLPAATLTEAEIPQQALPGDLSATLRYAFQNSPTFNAAIENVRAADAEVQVKKSAYHPRLDLRARQDLNYNLDGIDGRSTDRVVELVLSYNLYNGGSDSAAKREAMERKSVSEDLRENTCRTVRQDVTIAFNDIQNLHDQLSMLDTHQKSFAKVRDAARQQWDIGQRTLLDLLDTENEYFQARRSYTEAQYNYEKAYARTYAGMGSLMTILKVSRENTPSPESLGQDRNGVDVAYTCPVEAPGPSQYDFSEVPAAPEATVRLSIASYFQVAKADLSAGAKRQLDALARQVNNNPDVTRVVVEGNADSTGPQGLNDKLSKQRALTVKQYLISKGVKADMIDVEAYGYNRPATPNDTSVGRAQNRRVQTSAETAPGE